MQQKMSIVSLALLACACVSAKPAIPNNVSAGSTPTAVATRLQEQRIASNRYRISYIGPPSMSKQDVADHAMMGAAKRTMDSGNDWFEVADQASGEHTHSIEIVMGKGEGLAGGTAKQYPAKALYSELSGRFGSAN